MDEMLREADVGGDEPQTFPELLAMVARKMKNADTEEALLLAFKVSVLGFELERCFNSLTLSLLSLLPSCNPL